MIKSFLVNINRNNNIMVVILYWQMETNIIVVASYDSCSYEGIANGILNTLYRSTNKQTEKGNTEDTCEAITTK